eukprot:3547056-Prymnesium_polylepis.1
MSAHISLPAALAVDTPGLTASGKVARSGRVAPCDMRACGTSTSLVTCSRRSMLRRTQRGCSSRTTGAGSAAVA